MQKLLSYTYFVFLALLMASCQYHENKKVNENQPNQGIVIHSYGHDLFALNPMDLEPGLDSLLAEYSFFLGNEIDTQKSLQIRDFIMDPLNRDLAEKSEEKYHDISFLKTGLSNLFRQCENQFSGFRYPQVYTYISGLLYEMPVQYVDSVMIIGLDMFLGRNYEPYRAIGLPGYMTRRMEKEDILPECAKQVAIYHLPMAAEPKTLLDNMILEGKVLYAMDLLLPGTPDSLKIGYTSSQMEWCLGNEKNLWRMMIDKELLYSTDPRTVSKFIQDGPFTAGFPDGAPAMLGKYIGWQIVRSYMEKHDDASLTDLYNATDSQIILNNSGYKPKK
jgi:uncharacterized protein YjaZ